MDLSCHQSTIMSDKDFTEYKEEKLSKNEEILRRNDKILIHSSLCRDANCRQSNCRKMKNVIEHTKSCKKRLSTEQCSLCKSAFSLFCHHGINCLDETCSIAICSKVKQKIIAQQKTPTILSNVAVKTVLNFNNLSTDVDVRPTVFDEKLIKTETAPTMLKNCTTDAISNESTVNYLNATGKVKNHWSVRYQQETTTYQSHLITSTDKNFYHTPIVNNSPDPIQNTRESRMDHFQAREQQCSDINVGVSTKQEGEGLARVQTVPESFESFSVAPSANKSPNFVNNSPIFFNNNMYNVKESFSTADFDDISYNFNPNQIFPYAAYFQNPVPNFVDSSSNNPVVGRASVIVPPGGDTEQIPFPLMEINENDFNFDNFQDSCFNNQFGSSSTSSSSNCIIIKTDPIDGEIGATILDDDDDGIEIIAEIKNVEVVAELPKTETKVAVKRRRHSKETKAVVEAAEEDLTCCICLEPFDNPVLCFDCKKITGCKKCIDGWGAHCPSCRGTSGTTIVRGLDKISAKLRAYDGDN